MPITATHKKAIDHYYGELAAYHEHKVTHETAVRSAFQNLLAAFAQTASWALIPEQTLANDKRPDGTLRDSYNLPRGYWQDGAQPRAALASTSTEPLASAFVVARAHVGPGSQVMGAREARHVAATLDENGLGSAPTDTKNAAQRMSKT